MCIKHNLIIQPEGGFIQLRDWHQLLTPVVGGGLQPMLLETYEYKTCKITIKESYTATLDGSAVTSGTTEIAVGQAGRLIIKDAGQKVVLSTIVER